MDAKTKRDESVELVPPEMLTDAMARTLVSHAEALAQLHQRVKELESHGIRTHNLLVQVLEALEAGGS